MTDKTECDKKSHLLADCQANTPYDIDGFPVSVRVEDLAACPGSGTTLHWHDDVEFLAARKGSLVSHVDGREILIREGEGLFINARVPHVCCAEGSADNQIMIVQIGPSYLESLPTIKEKFIKPLISNAAIPWIHLKPQALWQKEILYHLQSIPSWYQTPAAPLRIMSVFSQVWAILFENTGSVVPLAGDPDRVIMQNMIGCIQHGYRTRLTLQDIADAGGVCVSKCCTMFQKQYQITPIGYLIEYRLSESAYLLRSTKDPVTEIALSCGFSDSNYYARRFHAWAGMTPTQYRKQKAQKLA